jgi:hypothetical protein
MRGDSKRTLQNVFVGAFLAAILGFLGTVGYDAWKANRPVTAERTRNPEAHAIDIEISNPSTTTYRAVQATFRIQDRQPPSHSVGAPIAADKIVFTGDDYVDESTYSRRISNLKIPANNETTFRVYIVDPEHANWIYYGHLTIEYGESQAPRRLEYDKHGVVVVADESMIP